MKDFLGRELNVGDEVVYLSHSRTSSNMYRGIVVEFTPCKVRIETYTADGEGAWPQLKFPYHVVKVNWSEVEREK